VTYAVLSQRIRLSGAEVDLLAELLAADGVDASVLSMVNVIDVDAMPMYGFSPTRARVHTDMGVAADRGPGELMTSAQPEDDIDSAALSVLALQPAVRAMWRSWRFPGNGAPWPRPRRIYLLETELAADLVRIAAEVQAVLRQAGEAEPQVEVYPMRADLPSYQRLARARGALMWTRAPDPGVRVARIFDAVDDRGPWMAADRATLAGDEAYRLLDYLVMGELVVVAAVWMDDVVDRTRRAVVPMNLRTDGHWVWSDASAYYLENHGLAPEAGLVAHVQARGYRHPLVDGAAAYRALAATQRPGEQIWTCRA
jgi:hypothetical protein